MKYIFFFGILLCFLVLNGFLKVSGKEEVGSEGKVSLLSKTINSKALRLALKGYTTIQDSSPQKEKFLAIVDFSISSTKKRFYLISMKDSTLVHTDYVAHGKHSGDVYANSFSNKEHSLKTSLGFYKIAESYIGKHGLTLRLDGLDRGYNDNARTRAVVMHAAEYAKPTIIKSIGRLGKSFGCPALPPDGFALIVAKIKKNAILFHYYPDDKYLKNSVWLH